MSADQARLRCQFTGLADIALPKTLPLPWWPSSVSWTKAGRWEEQERPGDYPVLIAGSPKPPETRVSYLLREEDGLTSVEDHLKWLYQAVDATNPVVLWLGPSVRGIFRMMDLSVAEVRHNADGAVCVADVDFTLKPAYTATMSVGPVKTKRKKPKK